MVKLLYGQVIGSACQVAVSRVTVVLRCMYVEHAASRPCMLNIG